MVCRDEGGLPPQYSSIHTDDGEHRNRPTQPSSSEDKGDDDREQQGGANEDSSTLSREEEVLILYGSQRGNSEKAAEEIASLLPHRLGGCSGGGVGAVTVRPTVLELDNFLLEERKGRWTRAIVIVVSSFGSGDAPRNARRFRKMCDGWNRDFSTANEKGDDSGDSSPRPDPFLKGLHFAILGFGDSYYKTFQKNPAVIEEAMLAAGAIRIGERGVVDAEQDDDKNVAAIAAWTNDLCDNLAKVIVQAPLSQDVLDKMQKHTERSI